MTTETSTEPTTGLPRHLPTLVARGGYSDRGPRRPYNEDAWALPAAGVNESGLGTLAVVADGVSGAEGGAEASRSAVQDLQALYYAGAGPSQPGARLRREVEAVNALNRLGQDASRRGRERLTTLVAAVALHDRLWLANVGDSRAYLVCARDGTARPVTEDHSRRLELIKAGLLDGDGPAPVHDGVLTHAIGLDEVLPVDLYQYTWEPGDRLVLCSDGLSRLSPATIAAIALRYPPPVAARELIEQANRQDGSDNSTAVILAWEGTLKRDTARTGQGWRRGIGCGLALGLLAGLLLGWFVASYLL